jgi:hypothetical protein
MMPQRIVLGVIIVAVIAARILFFSYSGWRTDRYETQKSGSQIAVTGSGSIEYFL